MDIYGFSFTINYQRATSSANNTKCSSPIAIPTYGLDSHSYQEMPSFYLSVLNDTRSVSKEVRSFWSRFYTVTALGRPNNLGLLENLHKYDINYSWRRNSLFSILYYKENFLAYLPHIITRFMALWNICGCIVKCHLKLHDNR